MSFRKTLFLMVVLLGLFFYITRVEIPSQEVIEKKKLKFGELKVEDFNGIDISTKSAEFGLINKLQWELKDPAGATLSEPAVVALLNSLQQLKVAESISKSDLESDLGAYGLDKPELTLKVYSKNGTSTLKFGKQNSYTKNRYLQLDEDSTVYFVPDSVFVAANKSKNDFRNRTPVTYLDNEVKSIVLNTKREKFKFESSKSAPWQILEPISTPASDTSMSSFNTALRGLNVAEFIDGKDPHSAEYGLDKPALSIRIEREGKDSIDVNIGRVESSTVKSMKSDAVSKSSKSDKKGKGSKKTSQTKESDVGEKNVATPLQVAFYMTVSGQPSIFKLSSDPTTQLDKDLYFFREKQFVKFSLDKVQGATFKSADSEIKIEKMQSVQSEEDTTWQVNGQNGDRVFVLELLRSISDLTVDKFPDLKPTSAIDFSKPLLRIDIRLDDGSARQVVVGEKLETGSDKFKNPQYYVKLDKLEQPVLISEAAYKSIYPKLETLIKREAAVASPTP